MKKTAFILAFLTCGLLSMAQSTTYRQNLEQTISHIVVSGNCIVCLEQDTCNWISYTASAPSTKERLVVIEGNRLTTTAAANDMTLHVGTTAANDSTLYLLTFDISDNAMVLYDGKVHTVGHTTINGTSNRKKNSAVLLGKKKYGEYKRLHNDFFFGWNQWLTGNGLINDPIQGKFALDQGWQLSYSFYMDEHKAAGIGVEYHTSNYQFLSSNTVFSSENHGFSMDSYITSDAGTWTSHINTMSIDFPLHFIFYPNAQKHSFSLSLELIPQFYFYCTHSRTYTFQQNDEEVVNNYIKKLSFSRFQLKTRFSVNYGLLGAYIETGLTPLMKELNINNQYLVTPYHLAFGLRLNLFNIL